MAFRFTRLIALFFAFAFGVIGGSVGLNALIQFHRQKNDLKNSLPSSISVNVDANDVQDSGIVLSVACAVIAVSSSTFMLIDVLMPAHKSGRLFTGTLQGAWLLFLDVWLFACLVPFTHFFATRSAIVTATIAGLQVPESIIGPTEQSLGLTPVYKHISYLRLSAIIPWFTVLFTLIAAITLFVAPRRDTAANRDVSEKNNGVA